MDSVNYRITNICIPSGTEDYSGRTAWATGFGMFIFFYIFLMKDKF